MEHNLFKYVWRHSRPEQIVILTLVAVSMPFYFVSLDLPKMIVNTGIQGQGYSAEQTTQQFMTIYLPLAELITGTPVLLFSGFALEQETMLVLLSCAFLVMVIINGLFKLTINTRKGRMGERLLRRLRYELSDRVLRFPLPHLRRMKQAEVATMIKDEVEPLGGFIGDAFVTPAFLGGQALTALTFIMVQSVWLGSVSLAIVLTQAWLIPRLRRRLLQLGKQRQLASRALAGRIGEVMDGATEMHANDTSNWERADLVDRLGHIFLIRFEIYQRKFFVKFLNNFLSQLTPFIFYLVGGLLALAGELDIGALVAVIAAYKDLPGPIKELIDWDQQRLDVTIKYEQVIEQFEPGQLISPTSQAVTLDEPPHLQGNLEVANLSLVEDDGTHRLQGINLEMPLSRHLAIVGDSNSGKERLAGVLAGLEYPTGGSVRIGGKDLGDLPEWVTGRRLGYVAPDAYHFPFSVRDNLVYGLKHAPYRAAEGEAPSDQDFKDRESKRAGNPILPMTYDWVDRGPLGGENGDDEARALSEAIHLVGLEHDIFRFGIYGTIDPKERPKMAENLLKARRLLNEKLEEEGLSDLVDRFDPDSYNRSSTLAENLLFGTTGEAGLQGAALASNPVMLEVLRKTEAGGSALESDLQEMGLSIARTMVELFADLPPGNPFFDQFSFIEADDLPEFQTLIAKVDRAGLGGLSEEERASLLQLTFSYSESRHRLGLIDEAKEEKILAARKALAQRLTSEEMRELEPYDPERYNAAAPILVNVLFGRMVYGQAEGEATLQYLTVQVLDELDLRGDVLEVGLTYNVGIGGKRLSASQRQLLAMARALLKDPDLLVVNDALGSLDTATQTRIMQRVREHRKERGIVWTMTRPQAAEHFDEVAVLDEGRLSARGSYEELTGSGGALAGQT
ncbi:MAG: ABC transporter ATP-binding protein [Rhodospirillales bacterium]